MSWMTKLHETYDKTIKNSELTDHPDPYFHIMEGCHIEITISENGDFKSAQSLIIEKKYGKKIYYEKTKTIIPITPKSLTGRTSGAAPYPLAEKIQYLAKDYIDFGGAKTSYFSQYIDELSNWVNHNQFSHWKAEAVKKYVEKGCVIKDLVNSGLLFVFLNEGKQKLVTKWKDQASGNEKKPALIHSVGGEQGNAIIRWRVQKTGVPDDTTWHDDSLIKSWQSYQAVTHKENGFCQILGRKTYVTTTHPKSIYPQAVNSKLISTPTDKGYLTYLGKFTDELQPVGISFEVSQKSHNALRWLIRRGQGELIGDSSGKIKPGMVVSWAVSGSEIPLPMDNALDFLWGDIKETTTPLPSVKNVINHSIDFGQSFANELNKYMSGYRAKLKETDNIVIMGLDSATDGRMAVTYYQELFPKEYIERISQWHNDFSWYQRHTIEEDVGKSKPVKKTVWPICAPSPRSIWEAIYGTNVNDSLKKNTIERILPCIVEARPFPRDLVLKAVQKATNRNAYKNDEQWLWEKHLCIACALFKGYYRRKPIENERRNYTMSLEVERKTRDYLYGRLLAVAEKIEEMAMFVADEKPRTTNASRLMQRFVDYPAATWLIIVKGIVPYQQRLRRSKIAPLEEGYKRLLDDITDAFNVENFNSPDKLKGEYLLGFHCQRKWLREHKLKDGQWILKENSKDDNDSKTLKGDS